MMTQYHPVACHADDKRLSAFAHSRMICSPGTTLQHATLLSGPGSARRMHASRCPCYAQPLDYSRFVPSCVDRLRLGRTEAPPTLLLCAACSRCRISYCVIAYPLPHYSCVLSSSRQHYSNHKHFTDAARVLVTPIRGSSTSAASPASLPLFVSHARATHRRCFAYAQTVRALQTTPTATRIISDAHSRDCRSRDAFCCRRAICRAADSFGVFAGFGLPSSHTVGTDCLPRSYHHPTLATGRDPRASPCLQR